jgi:hypothetical protein
MKRIIAACMLLFPSCELFEEAARKPGELKRSAAVSTQREEGILREFFTVDFAEKKAAHLALNIADFEAVPQPRPRLDDVVAAHGPADATWEADLSAYGVGHRAVVFQFGRLGLSTPVNRNDGEIFWTLILAAPSGSNRAR